VHKPKPLNMAFDELPPNEVLRSILRDGLALDPSGKPRVLEDEISAVHATALYSAVKKERPRLVVEVGMAFGISTLAILTALEEIGGGGRLISIDPQQTGDYQSIGLNNLIRAGLLHRHRLVETKSHLALPGLLNENCRIQFSYVDGWHTFDYTLVDFFYLDKMTEVGGVIAFNDCGWRAVDRVTRFVQTHRDYRQIDVGLKKDYRGRNPVKTLLHRLGGFDRADRYFRKISDFEPNWNFYARF
jgi:predicted O-methyltransferase YrrM